MKRAIIYASGEFQDSLNVKNDVQEQFSELNCFCTQHGIEIEAVFLDSNNERLADRTDLKHLLAYANEMQQYIDLCVFTSWDRFSTNLRELQIVEQQFLKMNIKLVAIEDCTPKKIMNIPKRTRDRIGRLSALIISDHEWLRKQERTFSRSKQSVIDKTQQRLERNEQRLLNITNQYTPNELTEQIENEDFQALNTGGDYGNTALTR